MPQDIEQVFDAPVDRTAVRSCAQGDARKIQGQKPLVWSRLF